MLALVTGATGKVGRHFIQRFLDDSRRPAARVRALRRDRPVEADARVEPAHADSTDNAKARQQPGWRPRHDLKQLIDSAWTCIRSASEPRRIWYPG